MPAAEVWAELLGQGGLSQMGQTLPDTQLRSQLAALSNNSPRDPREKWSLESESQPPGCQNKGLVLASGEHFGILEGYGQEGYI